MKHYAIAAAALFACVAVSDDTFETISEARKANREKCDALLKTRTEKFGADKNVFVARGVIADKTKKTVTIDAFTTGVGPRDIAEFFLITENSGHDYEALFMTFALPSDVCKAVEFIGVPRGRVTNYDALTFWPKGERLNAGVSVNGAPAKPLEDFVKDASVGKTLERTGFIYTGGRTREVDGKTVFIGDEGGPGAVIASYNESTSVLDVPRQAQQSAVYEKYLVNDNVKKQPDVWCEITFTPEPRPAEKPLRVVDYTLAIVPGKDGVVASGAWKTAAAPETQDFADGSIADAVRAMRKFLPDQDVYVTLAWSDVLTIAQITAVCNVLKLIDVDNGVRIEPPLPGDAYYKAFMPNEAWRVREDRFSQPCELRFTKTADSTYKADVVAIEEIWKDDALKPELKITTIENVTPDTLAKTLKDRGPSLPVLLIFTPEEMPYSVLKPFVKNVAPTHFNLHIFSEKNAL